MRKMQLGYNINGLELQRKIDWILRLYHLAICFLYALAGATEIPGSNFQEAKTARQNRSSLEIGILIAILYWCLQYTCASHIHATSE